MEFTEENIKKQLKESADVKNAVAGSLSGEILRAAEFIYAAFAGGNKVFFVGNGGSAADAQHIAAEFVGHFKKDRRPLPALALTTNTSNLTAIGNDYSFDAVFVRQLEAFLKKDDILVAISTSGKSPNIIKAVEFAKSKDVKIIGLLGMGGGELQNLVDLAIVIPSNDTQRIQESHITIGHIICDLVEEKLFG